MISAADMLWGSGACSHRNFFENVPFGVYFLSDLCIKIVFFK